MNDSMYTNIRNYLEELASQGKQLLAAQQRTNELLERIALTDNERIAATIAKREGVDPSQVTVATGDSNLAVSAVKRGATKQELEAETGHKVTQTGTQPPTFVETDKPAAPATAPKAAPKGKSK